jgi:hypothetical protein
MTSGHRSFPFERGIVVLADDGAVAAVRHLDGSPMIEILPSDI